MPSIRIICGANPHKGEKIMAQKTTRKTKKVLSKGKKLPRVKPLRADKVPYFTPTLETVIINGY